MKTRSKPILVTSPYEISKYLDATNGGESYMDKDKEEYYDITTEKPKNAALESLFIRALRF